MEKTCYMEIERAIFRRERQRQFKYADHAWPPASGRPPLSWGCAQRSGGSWFFYVFCGMASRIGFCFGLTTVLLACEQFYRPRATWR